MTNTENDSTFGFFGDRLNMLLRVLSFDAVKTGDGQDTKWDYLSWHPLNFLKAVIFAYDAEYNIKPDGWHEVSEKGFKEIYFNQPQPPGFSFKRWSKVKRP